MKRKNIIEKIFVLILAAGITVNSIPLSSYAAVISQTDSHMAVVLNETEAEQGEESGDGTGEETGDGTGGEETGDGTGDGTGEETGDGTGEETGDGTGEGTGDGTGEETGDGTGEGTGDGTGEGTGDGTGEETGGGTGDGTGEGTGDGTGEGTGDGTGEEIEAETDETKKNEEAGKEKKETEEEPADFDKQKETLIQEAKEALSELLQSEYVMALVYLSDYYDVMAKPDISSETVAVLTSGHTVLIEDVEADSVNGVIWYQVSFSVEDTEYTGYIEKDYLAYSNENFLAWEEEYIDPIEEFLKKNGISLFKIDGGSDGDGYSADVSRFPKSYRKSLQELKDAHPNWTFVKFSTGLDFGTVVENELVDARSLIYSTAKDSYKGKQYEGKWYYATREAVEYYLDPRNGLAENRIFQFEQLTFNSGYHKASAIQSVLNNSFMSGNVPKAGVSYAQAFYEIGQGRGISPFHLASRVLQEQGVNGGSALISGTYPGYEGYYNYFNIGASGSTTTAVIKSGLARAMKEGWNTPYKSLEGGAKSIGNGYILQGQDTLYLQKWDVENSYNGLYWHQYMQNIQAPTTESSTIRSLYKQSGSLNSTFVFKIPVYNNMPGVAVTPASLSLKGGQTGTVTYTIGNTDGSLTDCSSKDAAVATVEKAEESVDPDEGVVTGTVAVTARGKGSTVITLSFSDGSTVDCAVTVKEDSVVLADTKVLLNACSLDGSIKGDTAELAYTIDNAESGIKDITVSDTALLVASEKENSAKTEENDTMTGIIQLNGLAPGTATVTITSRYGGTAVCTVTIVRLPEKIEMMQPELTMGVGSSTIISPKVLPEDTTDKTLTFSSSDEGVAKVNASTGRVTAVGRGTAVITASTKENSLSGRPVTADFTVHVIPLVSSLTVAAEETELLFCETEAETFEMDGRVYLLDNSSGTPYLQSDGDQYYEIVYRSSDETIATVDKDGKVTAVGLGSAVITAVIKSEYSSDTQTAVCKVSVVPERPQKPEIPEDNYVQPKEIRISMAENGDPLNLCELTTGGYVDVVCTVLPAEAEVKKVTWTSSNEKVAKISRDTDGVVRITAGTRGNAVITVAADDLVQKRISVTVKEKQEIEEIILDHTNVLLYVNGEQDSTELLPSAICLTASVQGETDGDIVYEWTSTNENVAAVDENGRVEAVSPGTAVIVAEDTGGSGKFAKCAVKVERCLEEVRVNVEEIRIQPGKKLALKALLTPSDATLKKLEWKSGDTAIADVNAKGVVTVNKKAEEGAETVITLTDTVTGLEREIPLTVTKSACTGVTLFNAESGEKTTAATLYQNGTQEERQLTITASGGALSFYAVSSNEKVAVVAPGRDENGEYDGTFQITAKAKGTAVIKVYAADGSGKNAAVKVSVKIHPKSVSLGKDALYLKAGASGTLSAVVAPSEANEKRVVWQFADSTPQEVRAAFTLNSEKGKVTVAKGTAAGTCAEFVAVTKDGNIISDPACRVTVVAAAAKGVKLSASSLVLTGEDITKMEAVTLTAAISPVAANEVFGLKAVSSNESVAVIGQNRDENGEYDGTFTITPKGYGTATVTVKTLDNSKKAVCKVYVSPMDKAYKISAVQKSFSIQSYTSDINSRCTLQIKDQFGNILDNSLFTFTSNKTNIAVVDKNGVVVPNKAYESAKNNTVTVTAALAGDPYGRKVKFTVNVLAKEQAADVSVTAWDIRGKNLVDPESISVKYPAANTITLSANALNVYGEAMDTKLKWAVSDSSVASIKVDKDTKSAALTVKKAGSFYVTCSAGDTLKAGRRIRITAISARPVLKTAKLIINRRTEAESGGYVPADGLKLVENKDSAVLSIAVKKAVKGKKIIDPSAFQVEKTENGSWQLFIKQSVLNGLDTGNYKAVLSVETEAIPEILLGEDGNLIHEIPVTISIVSKKPAVSIKQVSINRQNITEYKVPLSITASAEVEAVEPAAGQANQFDSRFEIERKEKSYFIILKDNAGYNAGSITGKVRVKLKGYADPVTVDLKVKTPLTKAAVVPADTISLDVRDIANSNSRTITLYNKTAKQKLKNYKIVEVQEAAGLEIMNAANDDGSLKPGYGGTISVRAKNDFKYKNGGTVTMKIRVMALTGDGDDMWASPVDVKIAVKTYTAVPSVTLGSSSLTLNVQAAKESAKTTVRTNRSNVRIADDTEWEISRYDSRTKTYTTVKKTGDRAEDTGADIVFSYNRQTGTLSASVRDGAKVEKGTYKYRIKWLAEDYPKVQKDITVKVIDKKPAAKIKVKGKLDLLTRSDSTLQGTISLTDTKSGIKSVTVMEKEGDGSYRRNSSFYSTWLQDHTFRIKILEGVAMTTGKKTVPVRIVLEGGTVLYANVSFTVSQSSPRITVPKAQTIYKSERNTTVVYDMNKQIPSGYEISAVKATAVPGGFGVTVRNGRVSVTLTDRSLKPGTYSIKINMYFKGAQYVFGSDSGKAFQKTLKVIVKE